MVLAASITPEEVGGPGEMACLAAQAATDRVSNMARRIFSYAEATEALAEMEVAEVTKLAVRRVEVATAVQEVEEATPSPTCTRAKQSQSAEMQEPVA